MLDNSLPNMMIRPKTSYHLPITNYFGASDTISTLVESALQIHPFLTNKANFQKSQMNVSNLLIREYEQMDTWSRGKNKANSKPIQTQNKANTNPIQTQNKANSNPIQSQYKPKTNPISEAKNDPSGGGQKDLENKD